MVVDHDITPGCIPAALWCVEPRRKARSWPRNRLGDDARRVMPRSPKFGKNPPSQADRPCALPSSWPGIMLAADQRGRIAMAQAKKITTSRSSACASVFRCSVHPPRLAVGGPLLAQDARDEVGRW